MILCKFIIFFLEGGGSHSFIRLHIVILFLCVLGMYDLFEMQSIHNSRCKQDTTGFNDSGRHKECYYCVYFPG